MNEKYMSLALELAKKGEGKVNPNPLVGAVIVKNNIIIGSGYHEEYGKAHAEINAINSASEDVSGSTIYVTLEPCCHFGKTPPCCDEIIKRKFEKVVIGMLDPNPLVAGKGVEKLIESGIKVEVGVLESECREINEVFIHYITTNRPFVLMKCAMSLDGKISTHTGESKWISSSESRENVQFLRNKLSGIMVGIGTVLKDNPSLTCRITDGSNPVRIIVDSSLRIPMECEIIKSCCDIKTIIATTNKASKDKITRLESLGAKVLVTSEKGGKVNLTELMDMLSKLKIDSILLEGGSSLNYSALAEGIVNKVRFYIAPIIIGGVESKTPVGGLGVDKLAQAFSLENMIVKNINKDMVIEAYVKRGEY